MEASHQPEHGAAHRLSAADSSEPFRRFTRDRTAEIEAGLDQAADWGLFGPESTTWKVHTHPVLVVGGFRALMIQALHPLAMAGVAMHSDYMSDPLSRFRRTAQYVHQVVFSDTETARAAAAHVRSVHDKINGIDPVTGKYFSAIDPETLLWVHCAQAYSAIVARREFVGDLTEEEQDRYLAEFVVAGELIGIPRQPTIRSGDLFRLQARPATRLGQGVALRGQPQVGRPRLGNSDAALAAPDGRPAQAARLRMGAASLDLGERQGTEPRAGQRNGRRSF